MIFSLLLLSSLFFYIINIVGTKVPSREVEELFCLKNLNLYIEKTYLSIL
jgi:hypothetical protein